MGRSKGQFPPLANSSNSNEDTIKEHTRKTGNAPWTLLWVAYGVEFEDVNEVA